MLYNERSQEDRNTIINNLMEPYSKENFITTDEISYLVDDFKRSIDKIHKNTGPITSPDLGEKFKNDPVYKGIFDRIKEEVGECQIYTAFFFYCERPHIIHNDDSKDGPLIYKAITIPLELTYNTENTELYPYLCMFDQYYLEGPSKFFGGSKIDIPTFYNAQVYEYSQVQNKSDKPFDKQIYEKYMSHLQPFWLRGLSFNSAQLWKPTSAIFFDCARLHCASNFNAQGIKSKLGLSIFTKLR